MLYFKDWSKGIILDVFQVGAKATGLTGDKLYKYIAENVEEIKKCKSEPLHIDSEIEYKVILNSDFSEIEYK